MLADAATIIVPAHVQQSPAKSMALPLPRIYPVPEVATTNRLRTTIKKKKVKFSAVIYLYAILKLFTCYIMSRLIAYIILRLQN